MKQIKWSWRMATCELALADRHVPKHWQPRHTNTEADCFRNPVPLISWQLWAWLACQPWLLWKPQEITLVWAGLQAFFKGKTVPCNHSAVFSDWFKIACCTILFSRSALQIQPLAGEDCLMLVRVEFHNSVSISCFIRYSWTTTTS